MKIVCFVTMDVEVDKDPRYRVSSPPSFSNVTEAIPNLLEPLFLEYNVRPTYLISSEVMQDPPSVHTLKNLKSEHELGSHGHAELLGEDIKVNRFTGMLMNDFLNDYATEVQASKLQWLTKLFIETFGFAPKSFRGGRFGINAQTLMILDEQGYTVDSSITPGRYWYNSKQVVNYIMAPEQPYRPKVDDPLSPGSLQLWEVPVSCWTPRAAIRRLMDLQVKLMQSNFRLPQILEKILHTTLFRRCWLRPTSNQPGTLIRLAEEYLRRHSHKSTVIINIMFHTMEMVPGASPYSSSPREVNHIVNNLRAMLNYFTHRQAKFLTLSEIPACLS